MLDFDEPSSAGATNDKFSKYQRVSDNTVQNTLPNLKNKISSLYNVDAISARLRDASSEKALLMKELVVACWSRCIFSVILVHMLYLIHRLHLNLIGRRSALSEEVSDEDTIDFLKATNYLQNDDGIKGLQNLVDGAVTKCLEKVDEVQLFSVCDFIEYLHAITEDVLTPLRDPGIRRTLLFGERRLTLNPCVSLLTDQIEDLAESPHLEEIMVHVIEKAFSPFFKGLEDELPAPLPRSIAVLLVMEKHIFEGSNRLCEDDDQIREFCHLIWDADN